MPAESPVELPVDLVVEARGLTRILPGTVPVTLVRDIDLGIGASEFVAVTGPSGSGKSSLLYLLGLLDRPTRGEVSIEGQETGDLSEGDLAHLRLTKLGFVFQFHFLLPEFSVLQNVMLPMRKAGGRDPRDIRARAEQVLVQLGLDDCISKMTDQLSGGQRQRVAVARALANDPRIILADEPTGNLDTKNAGIVFDIFQRLVSEEGRSVIAVTHDPDLAARTDRRIHLVDGRIVTA
jgi:lipoprotein-releasing system ATP-binding protein